MRMRGIRYVLYSVVACVLAVVCVYLLNKHLLAIFFNDSKLWTLDKMEGYS